MNVSKGEDTKRDPETETRRTIQSAGDKVDAGVANAAAAADKAIRSAEQGVANTAEKANQVAASAGEELRAKVRTAERDAHGVVQKAEAELTTAGAKVGRKVDDVKADVKAHAQRAEAGLSSVEAKVEHTVQEAKDRVAETKNYLGVNVVQMRRLVAARLEQLSTAVERAGRDAAAALRRVASKVDVTSPRTEVVDGDRVVILQGDTQSAT